MKILLYDHIIQHDLTFRQVAELTGVPRSTVSDIANGKTSPTMNQMEQLAAGLKITISDLFESGISDNSENCITFFLLKRLLR